MSYEDIGQLSYNQDLGDCSSSNQDVGEYSCSSPDDKGECSSSLQDVGEYSGISEVEEEYDINSPNVAPPSLVQIRVSSQELDRMINSFIAGQRIRANRVIIREFCGNADEDSCARVKAINFDRKGLVEIQDASEYWLKLGNSLKSKK